MKVRILLALLIGALGFLSLGFAVQQLLAAKLAADEAQRARDANGIAVLAQDLEINLALERGLAMFMAANRESGLVSEDYGNLLQVQARNDELADELARQLARSHPALWSSVEDDLRQHRQELGTQRRSLLAQEGEWLESEQWYAKTTVYADFIQGLRDDVFMDTVNPGGEAWRLILVRSLLVNATEFIGRQRARLTEHLVLHGNGAHHPLPSASLYGYHGAAEQQLGSALRLIRMHRNAADLEPRLQQARQPYDEQAALALFLAIHEHRPGGPHSITPDAYFGAATQGIRALKAYADDLGGRIDTLLRLRYEEARRHEELVWFAVLGTVGGLLLVTLVLHYRVFRPLGVLGRAARRIQAGDLDEAIRLSGRDELSELAGRFEDMRRTLADDIRQREDLLLQTQLFQRVVDQTTDLVAITDREGRIEYVNPAFERITGLGQEEVVGQTMAVVKSDAHEADFYDQLWEELVGGEPFTGTIINRNRAGDLFYEDKTIVPLLDGKGRITHFVSTGRDVTERRTMERQMARSEKLASLGQLAAGVAHEINSPVAYVYSNLGTLGRYIGSVTRLLDLYQAGEPHLPAEQQARVQAYKEAIQYQLIREDLPDLVYESREGAQRVTAIVRDLRHYARDDSGEFRVVDLQSGLDSTLNIARNEIKYHARIVRDYEALPEVECIPSQINQVFLNLLTNAGQALEGEGTITVATRAEGDTVVVSVCDTGRGIPAPALERVFEPFFTTKAVGRGTGLGLPMVQAIVERHHGEIRVESAPGEGACFQVRLPVRQPVSPGEEA